MSTPATRPLDPTRVPAPPRASTAPGSGPDDAALVGGRVDRFEVRRVIGRGGMGVVVEAHDPLLGRLVALKLVDHERMSAVAGERLVREARAMARLAHPNVVAVHEVGEVDGRVFVVMELVAGRTLAAHLDDRPPQARILELFAAAGAGLAAAHDADLIHRDFKPSNVLVGDDGRVRVTDFGIARLAAGGDLDGDPDAEPPTTAATTATATPATPTPTATPATATTAIAAGSGAGAPVGSAISAGGGAATPPPLTRTGAAIGTPRYMAPEQRRGLEVTPRADQFSFCVALWEALLRDHPFEPASATTQVIRTGAPAATPSAELTEPRPPRGHDVPARVIAALQRGLAADPAARWPSMDALLAAIAPRRRRRLLWLAVPAIAVLAAVPLWLALRPAPATCAAIADERATGVWGAIRGARVQVALARSGHPAAPLVGARVVEAAEQLAERWSSAAADACTAARAASPAAAAAAERRLACLDRQLASLDGTLAVLEGEPSLQVVNHAEGAIRGLAGPDECAGDRDGEPAPPPTLAARLPRLHRALAEARASLNVGRIDTAEAQLAELAPAVEAAGWAPLAIRVELVRATALIARGKGAYETTLAAAQRATALKLDLLAAEAWTDAVRLAGQARSEREVELIAGIARAQAERTGAAHWLARVAIAEGEAYASRDRAVDAERTCRAALSSLGARAEPGVEAAHRDAGRCLLSALVELQRWREVVPLATDELTRWAAAHPVQHPRYAGMLGARALANRALGHLDEAQRDAEQALAIDRAAVGPAHPWAVDAMGDLAEVMLARGDRKRAEALYREAIALIEPAAAANAYPELRARRPGVVLSGLHRDLGNLLLLRDDRAGARPHHERSVELIGAIEGTRSMTYAVALLNLSQHLPPDFDAALAAIGRAREIFLEHKDRERAIAALGVTGKLLYDAGRAAEARPLLEQTVRESGPDLDPRTRGVWWLYAAQARFKLGERAGAIEAAREAAAAFRAARPPATASIGRLQQWLAGKGLPPVAGP